MKKKACVAILLLLVIVCSFTQQGNEAWKVFFTGAGLSDFPELNDKESLCVYFLDVGKADAILLSFDGEYAMIDAGTYDRGSDIVVWLKKLGIEKLKYFFVTHPDSDHIGGIEAVFQTVFVSELIMPAIPSNLGQSGQEYDAMISKAASLCIPIRKAAMGDKFALGKAALNVLSPVGEYVEINDYSLVLKMVFGDIGFLFSGDIEERAERLLYESGQDIRADVIKVAHHGSRSSSTAPFLKAVGADYAVISSGYDRNKLPKKEILARLEELGMTILRTDFDGTIRMSTDGKKLSYASTGGRCWVR